jgi:hypothetical protein
MKGKERGLEEETVKKPRRKTKCHENRTETVDNLRQVEAVHERDT